MVDIDFEVNTNSKAEYKASYSQIMLAALFNGIVPTLFYNTWKKESGFGGQWFYEKAWQSTVFITAAFWSTPVTGFISTTLGIYSFYS